LIREFNTLAASAEVEIRVRASRFLAFAFPVEDEAEARLVLEERGRVRFDATHHCAAWRFRDGLWRAIDAGEPSGSAGAPILAAIDSDQLVDTAVIVTRWFGGTKLGVGGLVRAYGEAAAEALSAAPRRRGVYAERLCVRYAFGDTSSVMHGLERSGATRQEYSFVEEQATVSFDVPDAEVEPLQRFLIERTSGRVTLERLGSTVLYRI
jgi:uncharacterized YigZ family protein